MFETADRLWLRQVESSLRYHAVGFQWDGFEPSLTCVVRAGDEVFDIDLDHVDFVISDARECVGYFDGDSYTSCPNKASVTRFAQCADCAGESFIPFQECVFEPKCDGEICDMDFCRREHVLYLAFYDTKAKIGMSSTRRIERRLVEQGADAFAVVGAFPTRRRAREAEKQISSRLRIPQAFRQEVVLSGFSRAVDVTGIEGRFRGLASSIEAQFGLKVEELRWVDGYPIDLPLDRPPQLRDTAGRHRGKLVGMKGKWLVYDSGSINALNLWDVPSRFIDSDTSPGSSLPRKIKK
ncbi:MAG: DUF2797 domain-containing protein [Candidatus Thermoplasmatota archaeon]|nr:DUF2797 domain-containing protein [Candidatus Thermoplasmatota archaeon]